MPKASSNPTQRPKPRTRPAQARPRSRREGVERALAALVVSFGGIAVLGFAATLLHIAFRDGNPFFAGVAWQYAFWLPLVSLPLAVVTLVTLVLVSASGKARGR